MPVTVISRLALGRLIFGAVVIALAAWVFFWGALHPRSVPKYDPNGPVAQIGATRVGGFLGGAVCLLGLADTSYARGIPLVFGVIELHRRGGDTDRISTSIMAEEAETVLARLQEVLENRQSSRQESRAS
jgi:hypothetical protein